ncbi:disulfide bond formation protein B [Yinghuangia soli]|uniref:Disulfide bond formation protein B n=1 Tax=Yinghuangia soli TaxID=2908204 RepID=A0AA41PY21_9ACTN|nr:disulfide bond formation protein B [Yinghuangia soli]MCF2527853.1 disulfide bond formation protein B [Yinghuangia soli]
MVTDYTTRLNAGSFNRLGYWFAHLYVVGMCGVLAGGFYYQFVKWEYPCPLCVLQRMFMMLVAMGPAYIIARGRKGRVDTRDYVTGYGIAIVSAVAGAMVSARQILLHIVPPDPGYGGTVFGLHLYTWALITFVLAIVAAGVMLVFCRETEPLDSDYTPISAAVMWLFLAIIAANAVAVFLLEGFNWVLPDDPDRYEIFY